MLSGRINFDKSLFIAVDYEIGRYFRKLYYYYTYKTIKLGSPSRGEHITIIPDFWVDKEQIAGYIGKVVEFYLLPMTKTNGNAIWVEVECDEAEKIREKFDFNYHKLHFCIGYLNEVCRKN